MSMKRQFIAENYPEWQLEHTGILVCPCGNRVEDDGKCPNGHVSPLRQHGFI